MRRHCNENDPRSVIFVSNSDKRCGTTFNFAHPPKWRWLLFMIGEQRSGHEDNGKDSWLCGVRGMCRAAAQALPLARGNFETP